MSLHHLRRTIPDATLLDWLELIEETPGVFTAAQLQAHWQFSQPAACRRIQRLQRHGLITHLRGGGPYGQHRSLWRLMPFPIGTVPTLGLSPHIDDGLGRLDVPDAGTSPLAHAGAAGAGDRQLRPAAGPAGAA